MKKFLLFIVAAVVVAVLSFYFSKNMINSIDTLAENAVVKNETKVTKNTVKENLITNTITSEELNKEEKNENKEKADNTEEIKQESQTETLTEEPKTAEEKAKNIVENDWGASSNIEITVEGMDQNGNYRVTVRNASTTEALAYYTVNTVNGSFNKEDVY